MTNLDTADRQHVERTVDFVPLKHAFREDDTMAAFVLDDALIAQAVDPDFAMLRATRESQGEEYIPPDSAWQPEPVIRYDPVLMAQMAMGIGVDYGSGDRTAYWTPANDNRLASRKGDFMQTYSGLKFWPVDPRADEVDIRDIAHSLAMQCRYGGHSLRFYSVAEHSVHMARAVSPENAVWALLHDAAEAYLADVPSPLKRHLPGYKEAEARVMAAVCEHFDLPPEMPAEVHEADARILADEIHQNMAPMEWHGKHDNPLGVELQFWDPERAEIYFLDTFRKLVRGEELRRVG